MEANATSPAEVIRRFESLKSARARWDRHWQNIADLVRPEVPDFTRNLILSGQERHLQIYDATAPWANDILASGIQGSLTSTLDRWFNLTTYDPKYVEDDECLGYLEVVSDIIYFQLSIKGSQFNNQSHELYLDIGSFGSSCQFVDAAYERAMVRFRTLALSQCYFEENGEGVVDSVHRLLKLTYHQMIDLFGESAIPAGIVAQGKKDEQLQFEIVHAVFPRKYYSPQRSDSTNKPFASVWVWREEKKMIKEDGFETFPFMCARWKTMAGEVYGRSPAMSCLPAIRMVNEMQRLFIRAGQKNIDPAVIVPTDGYEQELNTEPGGLIYVEPGSEELRGLEIKRDLQIGKEMIQLTQDAISRAFYADRLIMDQKKERETILERQQKEQEQLKLMSPHFGRLQSEYCRPLIERTFLLCRQMGLLPPAPTKLRGVKMNIAYVSPAATAQLGAKLQAMQSMAQILLPFMQVDPTVMDIIDTDQFAKEVAFIQNVTRKIIRDPRDIAAIRNKRQAQQEAQQAASVAQSASQSLLNAAKAKAVTPSDGGPGLPVGLGS